MSVSFHCNGGVKPSPTLHLENGDDGVLGAESKYGCDAIDNARLLVRPNSLPGDTLVGEKQNCCKAERSSGDGDVQEGGRLVGCSSVKR